MRDSGWSKYFFKILQMNTSTSSTSLKIWLLNSLRSSSKKRSTGLSSGSRLRRDRQWLQGDSSLLADALLMRSCFIGYQYDFMMPMNRFSLLLKMICKNSKGGLPTGRQALVMSGRSRAINFPVSPEARLPRRNLCSGNRFTKSYRPACRQAGFKHLHPPEAECP